MTIGCMTLSHIGAHDGVTMSCTQCTQCHGTQCVTPSCALGDNVMALGALGCVLVFLHEVEEDQRDDHNVSTEYHWGERWTAARHELVKVDVGLS